MNLDELLTQRHNLLNQLQALDAIINTQPDAPWLAMAATYIHTNQPVKASEVHWHTYQLCQQANLPAPSVKQLLHTLSALGFRRVRRAAGIYWLNPLAS